MGSGISAKISGITATPSISPNLITLFPFQISLGHFFVAAYSTHNERFSNNFALQ